MLNSKANKTKYLENNENIIEIMAYDKSRAHIHTKTKKNYLKQKKRRERQVEESKVEIHKTNKYIQIQRN